MRGKRRVEVVKEGYGKLSEVGSKGNCGRGVVRMRVGKWESEGKL